MNRRPTTAAALAPPRRTPGSGRLSPLAAAVSLLWLIACGGPTQPSPTTGLSISFPPAGQTVAGTTALAARGIGGEPVGLVFTLGSASAVASAEGIAYLDTRGLQDGPNTLVATATVGGEAVEATIQLTVRNDVSSSGQVGADGGALKTDGGSFVSVPPGAFSTTTSVSVTDTTQQEILDAFGVDYPALGVTFLGALTVDTGGAPSALPVSVDLAGWAQAVQPGQAVVMFALAPDVDSSGMGELMLAANAQATSTGSVVTRPVPSAETYGFQTGTAGVFTAQQSVTAQPGRILLVSGRGFNPVAPISNVARYGSQSSPTAETLAYAAVAEPHPFDPLQEIGFAVPATGGGALSLRLHNLNTGYATGTMTVNVGALGSGTQATWDSFLQQLTVAVETLTVGREDLATAAGVWLGRLATSADAALRAMAHTSGLVTSSNLSAIQAIAAGGPTPAQRRLVAHHALLLDAMAVSDGVAPLVADAAADLATLLMTTAHGAGAPASSGVATHQADADPSCGTGSTAPSAGIVEGTPITTGMGSAQSGSCGAGGGSGGGGGGTGANGVSLSGPSYDIAVLTASLAPTAVASQSLRRGTFRPVAGALVRFFRQGTTEPLTPFSSITDASGFFNVPFLPPNEPFTARAFNPQTLEVAEAHGVSRGVNVMTPVQLLFATTAPGGDVVASFTITPVQDDAFADTVYFEFDPSGSSSSIPIAEYIWQIDGRIGVFDWAEPQAFVRGFGTGGTHTATLTVIDEEFNAASATRQFTVDLPYDYWGSPPVRVNVNVDGEPSDQEVRYAGALSHDGRYVAFRSTASNLTATPTTGMNVFVKDTLAGTVELINVDDEGEPIAVGHDDPQISADGRYVAFSLPQGSSTKGIAVRDRVAGTTTTFINPDAFQTNVLHAMSADGRWLATRSATLNVTERPAYVVDLHVEPITFTRIGRNTSDDAWLDVRPTAFSADGRYLVVDGPDGLVEGDDNVRADVLRLDLDTMTYELVSVAGDGTQGEEESRVWGQVVSADGRFVAFWSRATTFPRATENDQQSRKENVYLKDMETGELTLISTNALDDSGTLSSILPVISADGRYVAFGSYATNLVPEHDPEDHFGWCMFAGDCVRGVSYVKDVVTGRIAMVTVALDGGWPDDWDQIEPQISGDGRYVGFYSWAGNLVPGGRSGLKEYFVAENPLWEAP